MGELVSRAYEVQSKHPENMVLARLTWAAGHSHRTVCKPSQGCWSMAPGGLHCILLLARSGQTAPMWSRALWQTPVHFPILLLSSQHIFPSPAIVKKSLVTLAPTKEAAGWIDVWVEEKAGYILTVKQPQSGPFLKWPLVFEEAKAPQNIEWPTSPFQSLMMWICSFLHVAHGYSEVKCSIQDFSFSKFLRIYLKVREYRKQKFFTLRDQETKYFSNITLNFNFESFIFQDGFSPDNWKDLIFKERNWKNWSSYPIITNQSFRNLKVNVQRGRENLDLGSAGLIIPLYVCQYLRWFNQVGGA